MNEEVIKIVMNRKAFGQRFAASIVGGRTRLMDLVGKGLIRCEKRNGAQNGKWFCNAYDCLRYAKVQGIPDEMLT